MKKRSKGGRDETLSVGFEISKSYHRSESLVSQENLSLVLTYVVEQNAIKQLQEGMDTRLTEMGHFLATYQPVTVAEPAQVFFRFFMQSAHLKGPNRISPHADEGNAKQRQNRARVKNRAQRC